MVEQTEKIWITPPMPGGQKIRHVGFLDLLEFYIWLQRWFEFNGYFHDGFEKFYEEKTSPRGKEIHIRWNGRKKINPYFTHHIELVWLLIGINDVEVPQGDKKRKIAKGDFELRFGAYVTKKGETNIFRKIYETFVIRDLIEENKQILYDEFYNMQDEVKAYVEQYVQ